MKLFNKCASVGLMAALLSACSLAPDYQRPELPVAQAWPAGQAYEGIEGVIDADVEQVKWQSFFLSKPMQRVIDLALANNRDLRVAALRIEQARAAYQIERAAFVPALNVTGSGTRQGVPQNASGVGRDVINSTYSANVATTAFELDFFGRIRSLNEKALEEFFATEEAQQAARIALIAETANAYLTYLADRKLLDITQETIRSQERAHDLIKQRYDLGIASKIDVEQARSFVETARANHARYTRYVAQDRNALELLIGSAPDQQLLDSLTLNSVKLADQLPVGLPSAVLLERPDVKQAEHRLKAANANIGAARAAFFPTISLTGSAGFASESLSDLFASGSSLAWTFVPQVTLPIFNGGRNAANLESATAAQKIALAEYEKAIQTAFREVADQLAARGTYGDQLAAQVSLVDAAHSVYQIARTRYDQGASDYLSVLDALRELYSAQQAEITVEQERLSNLVNLYKVLGGGR